MKTFARHLFLLTLLLPLAAVAQTPTSDSSDYQLLEEFTIIERSTPSELQALSPTQVIDAVRLERRGAVQLSDAVQQMVGLTLKDYGGVGGLKTVSARGLGSQFSTLSIDGVAVSDARNGQIDLGRYMLGNSSFVQLSHGQQEELLLTARLYAAGNVVNMESAEPLFYPGEHTHLKATAEAGSFGYVAPSLSWEQKLGRRAALSLWAGGLSNEGDYPFRLYYTTGRGDSSSMERRTNSAVRMATADGTLFLHLSPRTLLTGKLHYMQGYHQLPGPVTYYSVRGSEHSEEQLFFAQSKLQHEWSDKLKLQVLGKYQYSFDLYEDTAYGASISGRLRNEYRQQEGYLSAALRYRPAKAWSFALSSDAALATLLSNLAKNHNVQRRTLLTVAAASYQRGGLRLHANLLSTLAEEETETLRSSHYNELSPYAGTALAPAQLLGSSNQFLAPLRLRYFYKQTYRLPTFGEMYYVTMTRSLRPEQARQHNLGITYSLAGDRGSLALTVDGYRNRVEDKIVAMPTQNMYLWSMANFGRVDITGLDLKAEASTSWHKWQLSLSLSYAYQKAVDRSDSLSKSYNHQIPYTPRHSGGISLWAHSPWLDMGYDVMLVGTRYSMAQNSDASRLPAYTDHGLTASHTFLLRRGTLCLRARVLNLCDTQYEVVRSYPMMGRNFRISLTYNI